MDIVEKFSTMTKIAVDTETFVVLHYPEAALLLDHIRKMEDELARRRQATGQ